MFQLSSDLARLSGTVGAAKPLSADFAGAAFGTYLVEWKHRRSSGSPQLSLEISEQEFAVDASGKPLPGGSPNSVRRVMLSGRPQETETIERAVLRLGDRTQKVRALVQSAG